MTQQQGLFYSVRSKTEKNKTSKTVIAVERLLMLIFVEITLSFRFRCPNLRPWNGGSCDGR
jgi:hypothetical protein